MLLLLNFMQVSATEKMAANTSSSTMMIASSTQTPNHNDSSSYCDDLCAKIAASAVVSTIVAISVLIIVVSILIWYRKRRTVLINLTKHHKESDENSYTSSKHSHESGSKSPDPEYDVIKINSSNDKLESRFIKSKSDILCLEYSSVQSNVLKHEEDCDCGPMYSSVDTNAGSPHKIGDFNANSATYTDIQSHIEVNADDITDKIIPSNGDSPTHQNNDAATEDNSVKPHTYAEIDIKNKKANKDHKNVISKEFAVKGDEDSDEGSTPPPVPPQTTEMFYVAIRNENVTEKVN